jgi:hypothetical protein
MMAITDAWKLLAMSLKAAYLNSNSCQIGLYTNITTPSRTTTLSSLVEASFPGYSRITGTLGMGAPYLNTGNFAQIDRSALAQFTPSSVSAGQNIYGYFVCLNAGGVLFWAENNPAGFSLVGATLIPYIVQVSLQESQFAAGVP